MKVFVLDACALLAFLNQERGAGEVAKLFRQRKVGRCRILIHQLTLAEAYTDYRRGAGDALAAELFDFPSEVGIEVFMDLSVRMLKAASDFKLQHRMSFADSFVLALARTQAAEVVTSDHHEFDAVEAAGAMRFKWIR